jgi:hypothetical protein
VRNKNKFALLALALTFGFISAQATGQMSKASGPDFETGFVGSTLTCSQPAQPPAVIHVPASLVERAKVKARLATLLRDSLYDDAKGIVNIARENEIKKLANKLRRRD